MVREPFKGLGVANVIRVPLSSLDQHSFVGFELLCEKPRNYQLRANHEPDLFLDRALFNINTNSSVSTKKKKIQLNKKR